MKTSLPPRVGPARRPATSRVFTLLAGVALLSGCVSEPESRVVSAPPPPPPTSTTQTVVTPVTPAAGTTTTTTQVAPATTMTTTQPAPVTGAVVVTQAPPALQQEPVLERPSRDHLWVPGYWTWQNNRYHWISGRWVIPPRTGAVWVAPRWVAEDGAYRFYEGHWN